MSDHTSDIAISFEVFPPRDELGAQALKRCVRGLVPFSPEFVSVTYGADGSDRSRTQNVLADIRAECGSALPLGGHLTCLAGTKAEAVQVAQDYAALGAEWVVALRGDAAGGAGASFEPVEGGFTSAPDLVAGLRSTSRLKIAVGGYPEPHPDSRGAQSDLEHLKRKIDAGADAILTQFFFENSVFYRYVDHCRSAGITVPIIPGIMPIKNFKQTARFARRCGTSVPARLYERYERAEAREVARELSLAICAGQCDDLRSQGVDAFHFYTLNDAALTADTWRALGLTADAPGGDGEVAALTA